MAITGASAPPEFDMAPTSDQVAQVTPLVRERLKTLDDAAPLVNFVFSNEVSVSTDDLVQKGMDPDSTGAALKAASQGLSSLDAFDASSIEAMLRPLAKDLGIKTGQLLGTLRAATTGQKVSPPIFESIEVLGRDRTLTSIGNAIDTLHYHTPGS